MNAAALRPIIAALHGSEGVFTCVYLAVSSDELLRGKRQKKKKKKILPVTNCRQLSAYRKHVDALVPIMGRSDGCPARRRRISGEPSASQHS